MAQAVSVPAPGPAPAPLARDATRDDALRAGRAAAAAHRSGRPLPTDPEMANVRRWLDAVPAKRVVTAANGERS